MGRIEAVDPALLGLERLSAARAVNFRPWRRNVSGMDRVPVSPRSLMTLVSSQTAGRQSKISISGSPPYADRHAWFGCSLL
jgi:hypothetical protein